MTEVLHGRSPNDTGSPESALDAHRTRRSHTVASPQGNLALVNTAWVTGEPGVGQPIWSVPGVWSSLPRGVSGLRLAAPASDGIYVDGDLVDGSIIVAGMDALVPSRIRFSTTLTGYVIANEDGEYALRVWDSESEGIASFGSIEAFPYNPEWVVEASYTPISGTVSIAHLKDEGRTRTRELPGEIRFSKDGVDYSLAAYQDGPSLLLVFGDATNGQTTYSVGRFLRSTPAEDDGTIRLDFNRAYLPPCAFSNSFNCPIPPAQNRFRVPIEAGERNVLDSEGEPLLG